MKKESDELKKPGKSPQKRTVRNRRTGPRFEWGEVDNVTQEDMLLPAKKKKGNRRKQDRIESTLTVGGEEADPYAIKPVDEHAAADDPAIPSYGKKLEDGDDEYDIFLRNAERADQREKQRELAKKTDQENRKAKKSPPAKAGRSPLPEKETGKPDALPKKKRPAGEDSAVKPRSSAAPITEIRAQLRELRTAGLLRMEKNGLSQDAREAFLSSLSSVELQLEAIDRLIGIPAGQPAPANRPAGTKKASAAKDRPAKKEPAAELTPAGPAERPGLSGQAEEAEPAREKRPAKKDRPKKSSPRPAKESPRPFEGDAPAPVKEEPEKFSQLRENWTLDGAPLSDAMLAMLAEVHYEKPTPIQAGTIPQILAGKDLMGQSRTGSGKTAAFMIPIIEKIESCEPGDDPVALIVVPTRELAVQIRDETAKLAHNREIAVVACYGGKPIADQIKKMRGGVDIVIGTPGRILDLAKRSALRLSALKWVVLDEADRMLDIGFRPDIERILRQTPSERQTLLFSATLADEVVRLAQRYMNEPETCDFSENDIAADTIEQYYITVDRDRKFEALVRLLRREDPQQAIVFCRTKRGVDRLGSGLIREFKNWPVSAIHGDLTQSNRDNIMRSFRAGKIKILVATDVVGRGIDVSGISHIINYDIPEFCDDYVHRVGRTGRMGREGVAFTLVTSEEGNELTRIEMRINRLLQRTELEGFEAFTRPDEAEKNEPKEPKAVFGKPLRRVRRAL